IQFLSSVFVWFGYQHFTTFHDVFQFIYPPKRGLCNRYRGIELSLYLIFPSHNSNTNPVPYIALPKSLGNYTNPSTHPYSKRLDIVIAPLSPWEFWCHLNRSAVY